MSANDNINDDTQNTIKEESGEKVDNSMHTLGIVDLGSSELPADLVRS